MASSTLIRPRGDRLVLQHDRVGDVLDQASSSAVIGLGCENVEAQAVGRDQRALLRDMVAEHRRSASCSRCVAEWLARRRERRA
jgi:hypothetical protein